jgi:hypothetical protein
MANGSLEEVWKRIDRLEQKLHSLETQMIRELAAVREEMTHLETAASSYAKQVEERWEDTKHRRRQVPMYWYWAAFFLFTFAMRGLDWLVKVAFG